jgi:hypothetical protein
MPTNRMRWIRGMLEAKTVSQVALQLRILDENVRWDAFTRPKVGPEVPASSMIPREAVAKRLAAGKEGITEYGILMYGDDDTIHWMTEDKVPVYCIKDYEASVRKKEDASFAANWWRDFDFYPGVGLEVQFDGEWYQAFAVDSLDHLPPEPVPGLDSSAFQEGVGMVKVHYIGGRDDEDEWIAKDSDKLREDKRSEERVLKDRMKAEADARKTAQIKDKEERMRARLDMYAERKRQREEEQRARREKAEEKEVERARREQSRAERARFKELDVEERRKEREEKMKQRKEEMEKKKEDAKIQRQVCACVGVCRVHMLIAVICASSHAECMVESGCVGVLVVYMLIAMMCASLYAECEGGVFVNNNTRIHSQLPNVRSNTCRSTHFLLAK